MRTNSRGPNRLVLVLQLSGIGIAALYPRGVYSFHPLGKHPFMLRSFNKIVKVVFYSSPPLHSYSYSLSQSGINLRVLSLSSLAIPRVYEYTSIRIHHPTIYTHTLVAIICYSNVSPVFLTFVFRSWRNYEYTNLANKSLYRRLSPFYCRYCRKLSDKLPVRSR